MPTFKCNKSKKGLLFKNDLNQAPKSIVENAMSLREASRVHNIPIATLHRYKKNMKPGSTNVKKLSMVTTQVSCLSCFINCLSQSFEVWLYESTSISFTYYY